MRSGVSFYGALQQPSPRMIFEYLGIAHVTAQRVDRPMPAYIHHLKNRGTALGGRGEEARP
jgi:hypothetical protein